MSEQAGHRKRLRERFLKNGLKGFHDYEIVEILLTYGVPRKDCKSIAKNLIKKFKNISGVFNAPVSSLTETGFVGEHASVLIKLVKDLADAVLEEEIRGMEYFNNLETVSNYIRVSMGGLRYEEFKVAFLNSSNGIIVIETLQQGTVNAATVYPRQVIELAIRNHSTGLICFHNHPGGSSFPSPQDRVITQDILFAARPLGITLHDHLILGEQGIYSFRSKGEIDLLNKRYDKLRSV